MSKLIIVCGLGGSGKTTIAKALSKKLNIVCFHKDSIKTALFDELNFPTTDTYKLFFKLAEEQISNHVDVIIESSFTYKSDLQLLKHWLKKYDVELFCVICDIDRGTRRQRIKSRPRHDCHRAADLKLIENLTTESCDYSRLPGKLIDITTNKPIEKTIRQICTEIT